MGAKTIPIANCRTVLIYLMTSEVEATAFSATLLCLASDLRFASKQKYWSGIVTSSGEKAGIKSSGGTEKTTKKTFTVSLWSEMPGTRKLE